MKHTFTKSMVLITILVMDLLTGMEFDLIVPSFPALQSHFTLSPFWVEALLSVNFMGYCVSMFILGDLSDRYGRKKIIVLGLITFVIGSLACLLPLSYGFLLCGRLLQGFGIAAPAILSFLIIADSYPLKEQQFLMAMLNSVMNIAVAIAPVIGSYVTLYFHWQGNFAVLLGLGTVVLAMTLLFIHDKPAMQHESTSLRGLKGYISILKSRPLTLLLINLSFTFAPYWIFVGMSPLLYIKDLGVSLKHFGYYQGVLAFIFALGCLIYGFIIKHNDFHQRKMLFISLIIFTVSLFAVGFTALANSTTPLFITLVIIIFVIGQIIPSTILYPLCLNYLPHAKGRVSALIQGGKFILTAAGLQIAGYLYQGSFTEIGVIVAAYILTAIITLYLVINHRELIQ